MEVARKRAVADAEFYSRQRQASANQMLLTAEFLELKRIEAIAANSKVYFGADIPSMFIEGAGTGAGAASATRDAASAADSAARSEGVVAMAAAAAAPAKTAAGLRGSQAAAGDASATPAAAAGAGTSDNR